MISLPRLLTLAEDHRDALDIPVAPIRLGDVDIDSDAHPVVMGTINLSRDSTYRDSVATSAESAVRRGRLLVAQGADLVDLGAESTNGPAARVDADHQAELMVPVVKQLAADGVVVSAETYDAGLAAACLEAGASVVNYTGRAADADMFACVAEHDATLVLCWIAGDDARDVADVPRADDPMPGYLAHFTERVAAAREAGVRHVVVDPGLGLYYGNLTDPETRIDYQTRVLLRTFELRALGLPVCHALPHAFDLFQEQYRSAEPFFAVLARLAGTGMFRTHEVPTVRAALTAMQRL
jgi:dihydropteroate synthase